MSRPLSRRLADAACAFHTGHSVRDLDRVRTGRLVLLGRRLAATRRKTADDAVLMTERFERSHRRATDLVKQLGERGGRIVRSALLKEIEIERASLRSRRMGAWSKIRSLGRDGEDASEELKAAPVFSDERYGKLFEGLGEESVLDPLQHKLRLGIGYWHRFLRAVRIRIHFCLHGKLPVSLISHGRYPVDPGFGAARLMRRLSHEEGG